MRTEANTTENVREYEVSGLITFHTHFYPRNNAYDLFKDALLVQDKKSPWRDKDDAGDPVESIGELLGNPGRLPHSSVRRIDFAIEPGRCHLTKSQVYAYEKYLRNLATGVAQQFLNVDSFSTELSLKFSQECDQISALPVSSAVQEILRDAGITNVPALLDREASQLRAFRRIGLKSFAHIVVALIDAGYTEENGALLYKSSIAPMLVLAGVYDELRSLDKKKALSSSFKN